jgi:hypothetical protein
MGSLCASLTSFIDVLFTFSAGTVTTLAHKTRKGNSKYGAGLLAAAERFSRAWRDTASLPNLIREYPTPLIDGASGIGAECPQAALLPAAPAA